MSEMRDFVEWLSNHPTADEITRTLVLERMSAAGACGARISIYNSDDSLTFLGQYGMTDGRTSTTYPSNEWRSWTHDAADIATGRQKGNWSPDKKLLMITLRYRAGALGHLVIRFSQPVNNCEDVENLALDFATPISLYLSLHQRNVMHTHTSRHDLTPSQLTSRQLSILAGMVEGKTNHELATELGFSVSTIRHETMRIYQALGVSDRREAAKKALALSIL
jgi:DNA-binding CsgD family transcriptional regulator